jgi:hypothetical protein
VLRPNFSKRRRRGSSQPAFACPSSWGQLGASHPPGRRSYEGPSGASYGGPGGLIPRGTYTKARAPPHLRRTRLTNGRVVRGPARTQPGGSGGTGPQGRTSYEPSTPYLMVIMIIIMITLIVVTETLRPRIPEVCEGVRRHTKVERFIPYIYRDAHADPFERSELRTGRKSTRTPSVLHSI